MEANPCRGHDIVFLDKTFYTHSTVPFTTQVYKWVLVNLMPEVVLQIDIYVQFVNRVIFLGHFYPRGKDVIRLTPCKALTKA